MKKAGIIAKDKEAPEEASFLTNYRTKATIALLLIYVVIIVSDFSIRIINFPLHTSCLSELGCHLFSPV